MIMELKIRKEALGTPNDQFVKIVMVELPQIIVRTAATKENLHVIDMKDVIGIDIGGGNFLTVKVSGFWSHS